MEHRQGDPVDHSRTTRQHAGESLKHGANAPGLIGLAAGVIALVVGLFALATGHGTVGYVAIIVAAVAATIGLAWVAYTHRRVRTAEIRWAQTYSSEPAPPPSS